MHRRGFEPLTPWFVAMYSIQLSYRCNKFFYRAIAWGYFQGALDFEQALLSEG